MTLSTTDEPMDIQKLVKTGRWAADFLGESVPDAETADYIAETIALLVDTVSRLSNENVRLVQEAAGRAADSNRSSRTGA